MLFGCKFPTKSVNLKKLFTEPYSYWGNALSFFRVHQFGKKKEGVHEGLHSLTFDAYSSFLSETSEKSMPISVSLDVKLKQQIHENRKVLAPIIDCFIYCGRNGIALRGRRDDSQYHVTSPGEYSNTSNGNFLELLNLRVRGVYKVLENRLRNC